MIIPFGYAVIAYTGWGFFSCLLSGFSL